jgi:exosortase family protein XrtM
MQATLRFLALFTCSYGALEGAYFLVPDDLLLDIYHRCIVSVGADVIHLFSPREPVLAVANSLRSDGVTLEVIRGCDGAGVAFLVTAAIASFPARASSKLAGAAAGIALVYILNEMRIIGLFYALTRYKPWFLQVHVYYAPTLMIVLGSIYFAWWVSSAPRHRGVAI